MIHVFVKKFFKVLKNEKRDTVKYEEVGNIEKNVFVIFVVSKIK